MFLQKNSNVSIEACQNLFKGDFPTEKEQPKCVSPLNVLNNEQFLGICAIPANQAYAVSIKHFSVL